MNRRRLLLLALALAFLFVFVPRFLPSGPTEDLTYSELIARVERNPTSFKEVVFKPRGQEIAATLEDEDRGQLPERGGADRPPAAAREARVPFD